MKKRDVSNRKSKGVHHGGWVRCRDSFCSALAACAVGNGNHALDKSLLRKENYEEFLDRFVRLSEDFLKTDPKFMIDSVVRKEFKKEKKDMTLGDLKEFFRGRLYNQLSSVVSVDRKGYKNSFGPTVREHLSKFAGFQQNLV